MMSNDYDELVTVNSAVKGRQDFRQAFKETRQQLTAMQLYAKGLRDKCEESFAIIEELQDGLKKLDGVYGYWGGWGGIPGLIVKLLSTKHMHGIPTPPDLSAVEELVRDADEFTEGQWWLVELDALVVNGTNDQKRAVAVVRNLMQQFNAMLAAHKNEG